MYKHAATGVLFIAMFALPQQNTVDGVGEAILSTEFPGGEGDDCRCSQEEWSPGERQFERQPEIARGNGIAVGRQQRRVGLPVVIEAHGEQARHGIIGGQGELEGSVAAACHAGHRSDVATDGCLLGIRDVAAHVERLVETG